uniref:Zinc finger protein 800a n=1 Tax=Neogobius melanostomus TaxID=47308 RepID=A0A8C6SFC3_9GOBI
LNDNLLTLLKQTIAMKDLLDAIYPRADRPDFVVRVEPIQTTNKAVFQYLTTEEEMEQSIETLDNNEPSQPDVTESQRSPTPPPAEEQAHPEESPPTPPRWRMKNPITVEDVTISCCLCGQDFNSRRSIRRHCRKMHQTKLDELRKYTETRTVPTSLLSMSCPVCLKTFATKANVRRHFDEVHRGLRRDNIAPNMATKPDQPFILDDTASRRSNSASPVKPVASKTPPPVAKEPKAQTSIMSCRCSLCKRTYSSQVRQLLISLWVITCTYIHIYTFAILFLNTKQITIDYMTTL